MHHAAAVCTVERVRQLGENAQRLRIADPPFHSQPVGERGTTHIPHDEIPDPANFTKGVQRENACVRELCSDACLATESLAVVLRIGEIGTKHLDGHEAFECPLTRQIHRTHAAMAERTHDLVLLAKGSVQHGLERRVHRRFATLRPECHLGVGDCGAHGGNAVRVVCRREQ